ncbi:MAG: hypothetical protein LBQ22_01320 [Bacteroidales bacterium]|jgi:hypothetical protein|nr:hypothetical protein [Bacteroidales bacterium]
MDQNLTIVVIKILDRIKESVRLQNTLSKNSGLIKTRFGFHELYDSKCSRNGLIILEINGNNSECEAFISELNEIRGIVVKVMSFK